jgi:DNA-binding PadR family transcriptional regulator
MTNAELAIISLIAERPRHGYEIEQVIEERGMREWTEIGFSSIYYLLKKLEREGLIEGQLEQADRGPARKVFRITEAGREARHAALLETLSVPWRGAPPLMLGIGNLPALPSAEAQAALRQYRETLNDRLAQVRAKWEAQRPLPYFVDAMFDYTVTVGEAELRWVKEFIRQIGQMEDREGKDGFQEGTETPV